MDSFLTFTLVALIVLFASFVRGATGFGLAMTAMPLLNLFMPYLDTVILAVYLNLVFSLVHLIRSKGSISRQNLILTLIFSILGVTIGVLLLKSVNQNIMKTIAGIIVIFFSISLLAGIEIKLKKKSFAFSTASFFGGILAGSASIGGPVAAVILGGSGLNQNKFRYAMSVFFLVSYLYSAILYGATKMVLLNNIKLILFSIPFMAIGLLIGDKLAGRLDSKAFKNIILYVLILSGLLISYQGLKNIF